MDRMIQLKIGYLITTYHELRMNAMRNMQKTSKINNNDE
jgi:hypothetical protein